MSDEIIAKTKYQSFPPDGIFLDGTKAVFVERYGECPIEDKIYIVSDGKRRPLHSTGHENDIRPFLFDGHLFLLDISAEHLASYKNIDKEGGESLEKTIYAHTSKREIDEGGGIEWDIVWQTKAGIKGVLSVLPKVNCSSGTFEACFQPNFQHCGVSLTYIPEVTKIPVVVTLGKATLYVTEVSSSQEGVDPVVQLIELTRSEDGEGVESFQAGFYEIEATQKKYFITVHNQKLEGKYCFTGGLQSGTTVDASIFKQGTHALVMKGGESMMLAKFGLPDGEARLVETCTRAGNYTVVPEIPSFLLVEAKKLADFELFIPQNERVHIIKVTPEKQKSSASPMASAAAASHRAVSNVFSVALRRAASITALAVPGATQPKAAEGLNAQLFSAAKNGSTAELRVLLDQDATLVNAAEEDGNNLLMLACVNGCTEAAAMLVDKGASLDMLNKSNEATALMMASVRGNTDTAAMLVDKGAKLNVQSKNGLTALIFAAAKGHTQTVTMLLEKGAKVDIQDKSGISALIWAALKGHTKAAAILVDKGAKLEIQNENGNSALMTASYNGHTVAAAMLVEKGADLEAKNKDGITSLQWASHNGHTETAAMLIDKGANLEAHNVLKMYGTTSLMFASQNGQTKTVAMLIEKGAKLDAQSKDGKTALMFASQNGHTKTAAMLIDKGAKLEAQTKYGTTSLMFASQGGHKETAAMLMDKGAKKRGLRWMF